MWKMPCPCVENNTSLWLQGLQTCGTDLSHHKHPGETRLEAAPILGQTALGPSTVCLSAELGVEDTIIYLLNFVYAHLGKPASIERVMFFDFSSLFSTIRPALLGERLTVMQVDSPL